MQPTPPAYLSPVPGTPRLLDRVREALRLRHYSLRTERAYTGWIKRYILFHGKRHPASMGAAEVTAFLSHLAVAGSVAAATQQQALAALLFLYREVIEVDLPWLDEIVRPKKPRRVPTVLSRSEVARMLAAMEGTPALMACLPALRHGHAATRGAAPVDEGCGSGAARNRRARRQGRERSRSHWDVSMTYVLNRCGRASCESMDAAHQIQNRMSD
jgi:integrase